MELCRIISLMNGDQFDINHVFSLYLRKHVSERVVKQSTLLGAFAAVSVNLTRALLDMGADVNAPVDGGDVRAIMLATYFTVLDVVELLLERGADVTVSRLWNEHRQYPCDLISRASLREDGTYHKDCFRVMCLVMKHGGKVTRASRDLGGLHQFGLSLLALQVLCSPLVVPRCFKCWIPLDCVRLVKPFLV
jgi:hypothetical protein